MTRIPTRPPVSLAHRVVQDLLRIDSPAVDTPTESLDRVRTLVSFLKDFRSPVPSLPLPAGTVAEVPAFVPFALGQLLTQRKPAEGQLPSYVFPFPGQPVLLVGVPADHVVPDGARWDDDAQRWVSEDVRVVFNTPAGPMVTSVDSGDFEAWTEASPAMDDLLADVGRILEGLERDLLEVIAEADRLREGAPAT